MNLFETPIKKLLKIYLGITAAYTVGMLIWSDRTAGQFGDSFGAFNAFFAGLAFLGVIYTLKLQSDQVAMQSEELRLQREELKLQREELVNNRKELERTANAQEATEKVLSAQLRSAQISARLAALPALIFDQSTKIDSSGVGFATGNSVKGYSDFYIRQRIEGWTFSAKTLRDEREAARHQKAIEYAEQLLIMRSEMHQLYNSLRSNPTLYPLEDTKKGSAPV